MEAIRVELGAEKLTLFGISYGTELAIAYARAYPDRVERLILDSVVDPDDPDPFFSVGFRAMGPTLRSLCPDRCRGITADPAADLAQLVAQTRATPLRPFAYDEQGRSHRVTIGPTRAARPDVPVGLPAGAARGVPAAIKAGVGGDGAALARLVRESTPLRGARLAAGLLGRALRDGVRDDAAAMGSGHADRPAAGGRAAADRARAGGRVPAVRPRHRRRGRDQPVPALARRAARPRGHAGGAVPDGADAHPPGRGGPAHAA